MLSPCTSWALRHLISRVSAPPSVALQLFCSSGVPAMCRGDKGFCRAVRLLRRFCCAVRAAFTPCWWAALRLVHSGCGGTCYFSSRHVRMCRPLCLLCAGDVEVNPGPAPTLWGGVLFLLVYLPWMLPTSLLMACMGKDHHCLSCSSVYYHANRCGLAVWSKVVYGVLWLLSCVGKRGHVGRRDVQCCAPRWVCRAGTSQGGTQSRMSLCRPSRQSGSAERSAARYGLGQF